MNRKKGSQDFSTKRWGLIPGVRYPMVQSEYDRVWIKYCGFLDIDIDQFMSIQESLLLQQLSQITNCSLGRRLLGKRTPVGVEEFRHIVPTTTYKDYVPELDPGDETTLPEKPYVWANTTGSGGVKAWGKWSAELHYGDVGGQTTLVGPMCWSGKYIEKPNFKPNIKPISWQCKENARATIWSHIGENVRSKMRNLCDKHRNMKKSPW